MAKIGRPTIAPKDRASRVITLRMTPAEEKTLQRMAKEARLSVGEFIRTKLNLRGDK